MPKFKLKLPFGSTRDLDPTDPSYIACKVVVDEVSKGSITPRTLQSVTLIADDPSGLTSVRSLEEYEYCGNRVLRFKINAEMIGPGHAALAAMTTAPKAASTASTTNYLSTASSAAVLDTLEKTIITEAIEHLCGTSGGGGAQTVLVDIFERTSGETINVDPSSGHPITHTVVSYRGTSEILVVDPSNFLYSSHLANTDFNNELAAHTPALPRVKTLHGKIEIYKPYAPPKIKTQTGYAFDKYRDCTDVAVKLAFGFLHIPITTFDKKSIEKHPVVVRVTNMDTIDQAIVEAKMPLRIKQTSSLLAQEDFAKIQAAVDQKLKMFEKTDPALRAVLKQQYLAAVDDSTLSLIDTLRALVQLDDDINGQLMSKLTLAHQDLQTQHDDYEAELAGLIP
ncbi:MAG: hypothetical protein V4485_05175 [Pseudomonadota bacterium]